MSIDTATPPRILIVEDDAGFARKLARILSAGGMRIAAAEPSAESALERLGEIEFDVALLDLELPGRNGVELAGDIHALRPDAAILMLTSFADEEKVFQAMMAGACGYLLKTQGLDRLQSGIETALDGGSVIDPGLARRFWNLFSSRVRAAPPATPCPLTSQEVDVLNAVARGLTNREAAHALGLQRRTVRTILSHIYTRLGARSRAEAVMKAIESGWIGL
ncbi:MAG: Transcriptional regulatory protein DegU [Myxococcota bacterium]|nr:Transcriptional regulatory protein DegU [Myxococcota bacterium]